MSIVIHMEMTLCAIYRLAFGLLLLVAWCRSLSDTSTDRYTPGRAAIDDNDNTHEGGPMSLVAIDDNDNTQEEGPMLQSSNKLLKTTTTTHATDSYDSYSKNLPTLKPGGHSKGEPFAENHRNDQKQRQTFAGDSIFIRKPRAANPYTNPQSNHKTVSNTSPFNYAEAVASGFEFQAEMCNKYCPGNGHSKKKKALYRMETPTCADCSCDQDCRKYGNCCYHDNDQIKQSAFPRANKKLCFRHGPGSRDGAVLVSSCPPLVPHEETTSSIARPDDINLNNHHDSSFQTHVRGCLQCSRSSDKEWNPVSSSVTNLTYCNDHCLECNEPQLEASHRLPWATVAQKQCRASSSTRSRSRSSPQRSRSRSSSTRSKSTSVPSRSRSSSPRSRLRSSSPRRTKRDSLRLRQDCRLQFQPSFRERYVRPCIPEGHLTMIDTCSDKPLKDVDNETFLEMKSLCQAYRWPVYTDDAVFNNIFCFLCQGNKTKLRKSKPSIAILTRLDYALELQAFDRTSEGQMLDDDLGLTSKTCSGELWYNFLTRTCKTLRCNKGRQLITSNSSTSTSGQRCYGNRQDEELASEHSLQLYVLNVLWYFDGHNETNSATSDVFPLRDLDENKGQSHSSASRYCEIHTRAVRGYQDEPQGPQHSSYGGQFSRTHVDYGTVKDNDNGNPHDIAGAPGSVTVTGPPGGPPGYFKDSSNSHFRSPRSVSGPPGSIAGPPGSLDSKLSTLEGQILDQTHRKLLDLNVTYFLLKFHPKYRTYDNEDKGDKVLDEERQIVVYFQKTPNHHNKERKEYDEEFEEQILNTFSDNYNFSHDHGNFQYRSLLVKMHKIFKTTEKDNNMYFEYIGINVSENACCREIDQKEFSKSLSSMACDQETVKKPVTVHLTSTCAHVILNSTDFNMTTSQTLIHRETGIRLKRHQYLLSEGRVSVCASVLDSLRPSAMKAEAADRQHETLQWWEELLTCIFLPTSMMCLLVTFITYCIFPVLRSMPGKNNMFLVFWLFWAQTLILATDLAPTYSTACVVMAILLHYSWLVTLAWTCVCSFHMFNVFVLHKGASYADKSHLWYIKCYSLVCHLTPILVVASVCLSTTFSADHASFGYGGVVCYLNSILLVGVAFLLPLAAVLLANLIFFFSTIAAISRVEKVKRQTGIGEKRNTHTYARLSSLTGLTWCFALLAEIPGCRFLSLLSVIFNSSQGIFLFASFILNARVKKLWGGLLTGKAGKKLTTSVYGSSTKSTRLYSLRSVKSM